MNQYDAAQAVPHRHTRLPTAISMWLQSNTVHTRGVISPVNPNGNYMYHLLQQPIPLTFVLGFVWFSLQTAIISLNSVNQLFFVMVKFCGIWGSHGGEYEDGCLLGCSAVYLVEVYQLFRIALMMEAVRSSQTLVNFYQTTRRYNPEDSHLRQVLCFLCGTDEMLKYYLDELRLQRINRLHFLNSAILNAISLNQLDWLTNCMTHCLTWIHSHFPTKCCPTEVPMHDCLLHSSNLNDWLDYSPDRTTVPKIFVCHTILNFNPAFNLPKNPITIFEPGQLHPIARL
jgi:hypothetical protein